MPGPTLLRIFFGLNFVPTPAQHSNHLSSHYIVRGVTKWVCVNFLLLNFPKTAKEKGNQSTEVEDWILACKLRPNA